MNPLDRMEERMDAAGLETWKSDVTQATQDIKRLSNILENNIMNKWELARDEAGDPGKHDIDALFTELTNAKAALCALNGGRRSRRRSKALKRTRKHRR